MAPSITFVAPIIRAAIDKLKADLPGQITAFNAEAANTVDLTAPDNANYFFGAADPPGTAGYPVVEVAAVDGRATNFALENVEWDDFIRLQVVVWHEGDKGELSPTYEMSLGLARCVIEVLAQPGAFGTGIELVLGENGMGYRWSCAPIESDLAEDERTFRKWLVPVLVEFTLEAIERRV